MRAHVLPYPVQRLMSHLTENTLRWLMVYGEIISVYFKKHKEHTNTLNSYRCSTDLVLNLAVYTVRTATKIQSVKKHN